MTQNKRAISYYRKSDKVSGVIDERLNINLQDFVVQNYCDAQNIQIIQHFNDLDYKNRTLSRPELVQMLQLLQESRHRFDFLLFYTIGYIGKDLYGHLNLMLKISEFFEEIVFVEENLIYSREYFQKYLRFELSNPRVQKMRFLREKMKVNRRVRRSFLRFSMFNEVTSLVNYKEGLNLTIVPLKE